MQSTSGLLIAALLVVGLAAQHDAAAVESPDPIAFLHGTCMYSMAGTSMPSDAAKEFCSCFVVRVVQVITPAQRLAIGRAARLVQSGQQPDVQSMRAAGTNELGSEAQAYCDNYLYKNTGAANESERRSYTVRSNQSVREFDAFIRTQCPHSSHGGSASTCEYQAAKDWIRGPGRQYDGIPYPYITGNSLAAAYLPGGV